MSSHNSRGEEFGVQTNVEAQSCTCHPDDGPPVPCARRFALTECREAVAELLTEIEGFGPEQQAELICNEVSRHFTNLDEAQRCIPSEASTGNPATDTLNLNPLPPDIKEIVKALQAPSFEQDSQWHNPKAVYATKPRDLLNAAASALLSLAGEREEARRERDHWKAQAQEDEATAIRSSQSSLEHLVRAQAAERQLAEAVGIIRKVWKLSTRQGYEITRLVDVQDCVGSFLAQHQSPQSARNPGEAEDEK